MINIFLIESIQKDNHTELVIFSRDKNDEKKVEVVRDFRPYFYIDEKEPVPDDYRITSVETGHKTLLNEPVKKIFVKRSKDVVGVRSLFEKHYEADILFTQRYIIDELGEVDIYKLHVLSLDIETDSNDSFPNIDKPDQVITTCAFADNKGFKRKYINKNPQCKVDIKIDENTRVFKTEEQLLQAIVALVKRVDPDVITGWNVINFDLAYLINRLKQFNINYHVMSPLNMVFCNNDRRDDNKYDITIRGRLIIDGMDAYMHFRKISNQGKAAAYSLEFTGQSVLGYGKLKHETNFHDMWINNPNELIEYNLRDTEMVIDILDKLKIIEFFNSIRAKSCALLNQIYQTSSLVDGYMLRMSHNKYVLPSKNKQKGEKFSGALVLPPKPGKYKNILALDLKALYPNIIKTFNVGYETFNPEGEIKLKEGIGFDRGIGMCSQLMRTLEKERQIYKDLKWKADQEDNEDEKNLNHYRQFAIKILMNAVYGYLGYEGSRLYKKEVAEAVTIWGQIILKWSKTVLENNGYEVIYGDTDSVYVKPKETTFFSLLKEGKRLIDIINKSYPQLAKKFGSEDCNLEMEFEKIFKKLLFVSKKGTKDGEGAKKKYAYILLWENKKKITDEVKFTGFEQVRSDTPKLARDTQTKVVEMVMADADKKDIIDYLRQLDSDIRSKKILDEDIAFPKGISKRISDYGKIKENNTIGIFGEKVEHKIGIPPVITGAIYANKYLGRQFAQGNKPKWIYVKSVPKGYPNTHVITFDTENVPEGFKIDYDVMIDKLFKQKLEAIFMASGFGEFPNIDSRIKNNWW